MESVNPEFVNYGSNHYCARTDPTSLSYPRLAGAYPLKSNFGLHCMYVVVPSPCNLFQRSSTVGCNSQILVRYNHQILVIYNRHILDEYNHQILVPTRPP